MKKSEMAACLLALTSVLLAASGCGGEDADKEGNENEVITTVTLTFTASGGGVPVVAKVDDPDGDGGNAPTVEPVNLSPGTYDLTVRFENRLEKPAEDITKEVRDESAEHQVFFTGTAVTGPASASTTGPLAHAYADMDSKALPLGLANKITASAGSGDLTVTLRHMPPINNAAVKTAAVAETVRAGGFAAIGGSTDAQVTFPVTVR